jgi:hypothetical protein
MALESKGWRLNQSKLLTPAVQVPAAGLTYNKRHLRVSFFIENYFHLKVAWKISG